MFCMLMCWKPDIISKTTNVFYRFYNISHAGMINMFPSPVMSHRDKTLLTADHVLSLIYTTQGLQVYRYLWLLQYHLQVWLPHYLHIRFKNQICHFPLNKHIKITYSGKANWFYTHENTQLYFKDTGPTAFIKIKPNIIESILTHGLHAGISHMGFAITLAGMAKPLAHQFKRKSHICYSL